MVDGDVVAPENVAAEMGGNQRSVGPVFAGFFAEIGEAAALGVVEAGFVRGGDLMGHDVAFGEGGFGDVAVGVVFAGDDVDRVAGVDHDRGVGAAGGGEADGFGEFRDVEGADGGGVEDGFVGVFQCAVGAEHEVQMAAAVDGEGGLVVAVDFDAVGADVDGIADEFLLGAAEVGDVLRGAGVGVGTDGAGVGEKDVVAAADDFLLAVSVAAPAAFPGFVELDRVVAGNVDDGNRIGNREGSVGAFFGNDEKEVSFVVAHEDGRVFEELGLGIGFDEQAVSVEGAAAVIAGHCAEGEFVGCPGAAAVFGVHEVPFAVGGSGGVDREVGVAVAVEYDAVVAEAGVEGGFSVFGEELAVVAENPVAVGVEGLDFGGHVVVGEPFADVGAVFRIEANDGGLEFRMVAEEFALVLIGAVLEGDLLERGGAFFRRGGERDGLEERGKSQGEDGEKRKRFGHCSGFEWRLLSFA